MFTYYVSNQYSILLQGILHLWRPDLAFLLFWCVSTTYDGRQDFLIFLKPDKLFYRIEFHTIQYPRNMLYMNLWYCKVWNSILTICWLLQFVILIYYKKLQWPEIEPGPSAWELSVLSTLLWGLDNKWLSKFLIDTFFSFAIILQQLKVIYFQNFFSQNMK